jgi:DNA-binding transcriptional MerR regulator
MPERPQQTERPWTIRRTADHFGLTLRTLRHWEEHSLLDPEWIGDQRRYGTRERTRIELILRGKRLGFSLEKIAVIVNMYDEPPGEVGQLRYLIEQCDVRREELHQRQRDIEATLAELDQVEERCHTELARLPDAHHSPPYSSR